jgi:hypothetical protein
MGDVVSLNQYRLRRGSRAWQHAVVIPWPAGGLHELGIEYVDEHSRLHMKPLELSDFQELRKLAVLNCLGASSPDVRGRMVKIGLGNMNGQDWPR